MPERVLELGHDRQLIDLDFRDTEGLVGSYILPQADGRVTLIETGPASCRTHLSRGLAQAGVEADQVDRVFVTHIHLDHAGGMGVVAEMFPQATLYAHHLGVPHLVDPSKLVASARRAWGASADPLWGPIVPVPADRIVPLHGGETYPLRSGVLEVLNTPGHAKHHLAFVDTGIRGLFTGDGAGVRLEGAPRPRPALPPPDLDLELLTESVERMARTQPRQLLYSHFGPSAGGEVELRTFVDTVRAWRDRGLAAARESPTSEHVAAALRRYEEETRDVQGPAGTSGDRGELISGYDLAAKGLLRYFETHGLLPGGAT
ncbi:MAG: MBL fold metallo-hydrolase [Thermoplasmata archaeon]